MYKNLNPEEIKVFSSVKRFSELYSADKKFRDICKYNNWKSSEIQDYLDPYGIYSSIPEYFFNDLKRNPLENKDKSAKSLIEDWNFFYKKKLAHREALKKYTQQSITNESISSWRTRVVKQNMAQMDSAFLDGNVYPLFSIELSEGCSVGCPFCGIGAEGLKEHFLATDENITLFKKILASIKSNMGENSGMSGFLYWATEPLDNPDYQVFEKSYCDVLGFIPQLTTAIAYKDVEKVRSIISNRSASRISPHRFSVLSMGALKKIYKAFSPEDLLDVEIIPQMNGSLVVKANAGKNYSEKTSGNVPDTIACVAGLLINMPRKEVKIISPCPASEEHPLGYITYDTRFFKDSHDFDHIIKEWEDTYFNIKPKSEDIISIWPEVNLSEIIESGKITTKNINFNLSENSIAKFLIDSIHHNKSLKMKTLMSLAVNENYDVFHALGAINELISEGIFNIDRLEKKQAHMSPIYFLSPTPI